MTGLPLQRLDSRLKVLDSLLERTQTHPQSKDQKIPLIGLPWLCLGKPLRNSGNDSLDIQRTQLLRVPGKGPRKNNSTVSASQLRAIFGRSSIAESSTLSRALPRCYASGSPQSDRPNLTQIWARKLHTHSCANPYGVERRLRLQDRFPGRAVSQHLDKGAFVTHEPQMQLLDALFGDLGTPNDPPSETQIDMPTCVFPAKMGNQ